MGRYISFYIYYKFIKYKIHGIQILGNKLGIERGGFKIFNKMTNTNW